MIAVALRDPVRNGSDCLRNDRALRFRIFAETCSAINRPAIGLPGGQIAGIIMV